MCRVEVDKPKPAVSMHAKLERIAQKKVCLFLTLSAKVLVGGFFPCCQGVLGFPVMLQSEHGCCCPFKTV
jgi:hypothetical protein